MSNAELLGPQAPATGEPVKVGFITDGEADGSAAQNEEPVAKATVQWLNEHMNGLAGHPISLDICVDHLDPGTATDCANQMIRDNVAVVVIGSNGVIESSWNLLHDAHIPVINNAVTISTLLEDPDSTFIVNDPLAQVVDVPDRRGRGRERRQGVDRRRRSAHRHGHLRGCDAGPLRAQRS